MTANDRGGPDSLIVESRILREGFTQIPNSVLRNPKLSAAARLVYGLLLSFQWRDPGIFPGRERMAEYLGASVDSVDRCLNQLRDAGLIAWTRRGRGDTNIYRILESPYRKNADHFQDSLPSESAPVRTLESAPAPTKQYTVNKTPPNPLKGEALSENSDRKNAEPKRAKPRRRIPDDFTLTPELRAFAIKHGIADPDRELESFTNYWQGDGRPKADWNATFRTRCLEQEKRRHEHGGAPMNGMPPEIAALPHNSAKRLAWEERRRLAAATEKQA